MRPDGFGGSAMLISAADVVSTSTAGFLEDAIAALLPGTRPD